MFGIKDRQRWLSKPSEVIKDVLSKPSRRTHPYIYFGFSNDRCIDTGDYILGNTIEADYSQHDPQQSFSTVRITDHDVATSIRSELLSMFPAAASVPPGTLHLNNLMSAVKSEITPYLNKDSAWVIDNQKKPDEPIMIYQPISKHFMDRFVDAATVARDRIVTSQMSFPYTDIAAVTQSGRLTLHTLPDSASSEVRAITKTVTCASFVGYDLISPNMTKVGTPELVVVSIGADVYTTGSKYIEPGIEITMSRPFNIIFAKRGNQCRIQN